MKLWKGFRLFFMNTVPQSVKKPLVVVLDDVSPGKKMLSDEFWCSRRLMSILPEASTTFGKPGPGLVELRAHISCNGKWDRKYSSNYFLVVNKKIWLRVSVSVRSESFFTREEIFLHKPTPDDFWKARLTSRCLEVVVAQPITFCLVRPGLNSMMDLGFYQFRIAVNLFSLDVGLLLITCN